MKYKCEHLIKYLLLKFCLNINASPSPYFYFCRIWILSMTCKIIVQQIHFIVVLLLSFYHWLTESVFWPVCAVQLHHLVLQLLGLTLGHFHLLSVFIAMHLRVILSQLWLQGVGAQQGQGHKRTGQPAMQDVLAQLQTQVVPAIHKQGSHVLSMELQSYESRWS